MMAGIGQDDEAHFFSWEMNVAHALISQRVPKHLKILAKRGEIGIGQLPFDNQERFVQSVSSLAAKIDPAAGTRDLFEIVNQLIRGDYSCVRKEEPTEPFDGSIDKKTRRHPQKSWMIRGLQIRSEWHRTKIRVVVRKAVLFADGLRQSKTQLYDSAAMLKSPPPLQPP